MFWTNISNEERLSLWKNLRNDIELFNLEHQLAEIAKFCAGMPFGSRTLDYYSPEDWPTPWEILFHGSFCKSSISLIIFYTLDLLPSEKEIELYLIDDQEDIYLLPIINNHFVLNYYLGEVSSYSEISNEFTILKKYKKEQIKKII